MSPSCSRRRLGAALLALWLATGIGCATPVLSVEDEQELGRQVAAELVKEPRILRDDLVRSYVEKLGERILAAAGPQPFEYTFYVLDDPNINAFAAPGGHVVVHTGLILEADNMSELAGVMGHEVGHVALRHVARSYYRNRTTGILATLVGAAFQIFLGGYGGYGGAMATDLLATAYLASYSRDAEREADLFAVEVLPQAGISPSGLPSFFETMMQEGGANPPLFLSTHPAHEERVENARRAIAERDIGGDLDVDDDGRLEIVQRRIEILTGR